ncbi:MAG: hypothetical protein IBJ00_00155 [Alphaproteobacteria bacterium]|nr:hypothetical protein [Alphaproteobacteria bacterium]
MTTREKYLNDLNQQLTKYGSDLSNLKDDIKNRTSSDFAKTFKGAQQAFKQAEKAYESIKSAAEDKWEDLKDSTAQVFEELSQSFKGFGNLSSKSLSEFQEKCQEALKDRVQRNPLATVLVVWTIGYILGKITK